MQFIFNFDENKKKPLYVQLYEGIKNEIVHGYIQPNSKMPSIRSLAITLNMSKTTIENAYNQLLVEGYIYSIAKKGYYVKNIKHTLLHNNNIIQTKNVEDKTTTKILYNLTNDNVEEKVVNMKLWKKTILNVLDENTNELLSYGEVQGELFLREEITRYLYQARGVYTKPNQLVIGAGIQPLLIILAHIFSLLNKNKLAFEDPGFNKAKDILRNNLLKLIPIPVKEEGIDIEYLKKSQADLCYVSPSHQFPTGTVMPINKRMELINWATTNEKYIIEDDYNSELRYTGRPIPSLQGLVQGKNVVYLGSFSTVFLPSIRISFMVLPLNLTNIYQSINKSYAQTASKLEQLSLANFINKGYFDKHIRRIKAHYAKKSEIIQHLIKKIFKDKVIIHSSDSGFILYVELIVDKDEKTIQKMCEQKGIKIHVLSDYIVNKITRKYPVVILSYKGMNSKMHEQALIEIYKVCFDE